MKIFNEENGTKKVYVQMNDIMMLNTTDEPIPASIYEKIFTNVVIVDDRNRMDFVEFTNNHEIEFFNKLDWIVDYKKLRNLSLEEIQFLFEETNREMNEIANKFNNMSDEDKEKNQSLIQKHELLEYKLNYFREIYWMKQGKSNIEIPLVPDNEGFKLNDDNSNYQISASLEPNKLLLFKKDGKPLSPTDKVPQGLLQGAIGLATMEKSQNNTFMGDYSISTSLSKDNKYLIIEFKVKSYDEKENTKDTKKENGIKRLINKFLKK